MSHTFSLLLTFKRGCLFPFLALMRCFRLSRAIDKLDLETQGEKELEAKILENLDEAQVGLAQVNVERGAFVLLHFVVFLVNGASGV